MKAVLILSLLDNSKTNIIMGNFYKLNKSLGKYRALRTNGIVNIGFYAEFSDNGMDQYYNGSFDDLSKNGVLNTSTTNATDVVIVKTEISRVESLPEGVTLDNAYKSDSLYNLMDSSGQFSMGNTSSLQISGKQARQFNYNVGYTVYKDTWIESNGHYYRILSQAPNPVYKNAQPQFDFIVESFKVKN